MQKDALQVSYNIFFVLIFLNLLFLNFWVLGYVKPFLKAATSYAPAVVDTGCDQDCIDSLYTAIYNATSSSQEDSLSSKSANAISKPRAIVREYYVPLGSGTNKTTTWANVDGVQAYIDTLKYGSIQSVTFEATIFVPTGNQTAYVRLYNVTDSHPVWLSELSMSGGQQQLLTSDIVTLDSGKKLYQVQMMSQLGFLTNLVSARVHILAY